jgi:hypothetical protein
MLTRTTALIAAGGVLAGAAVVGIPALVVAATDDDEWPGPGRFMDDEDWGEDWQGRGFGMMQGRRGDRMMGGFGGRFPEGRGMMDGPFGWSDGEPAGELSDAQADQLATMAEREKLARDLYTAFADATDDVRFRHLAMGEAHHLAALQAMLDVYDVTDPTATSGPGEFADDEVAADYDALLEEGSGSEEAAIEVARGIEEEFVDTLGDAARDVEDDASDVSRVYEHLAFASERHLDLLEE